MVAQFDTFYIIGNRVESFGLRHYFVRWHEKELSISIDEFLNEPRADDAINFDTFSGNPLHFLSPSFSLNQQRNTRKQQEHQHDFSEGRLINAPI